MSSPLIVFVQMNAQFFSSNLIGVYVQMDSLRFKEKPAWTGSLVLVKVVSEVSVASVPTLPFVSFVTAPRMGHKSPVVKFGDLIMSVALVHNLLYGVFSKMQALFAHRFKIVQMNNGGIKRKAPKGFA